MLTKNDIKVVMKRTTFYKLYKEAGKIQNLVSKKLKKIIESKKYAKKPHYLYIEPVNICNANCIFCAYQYDQRPKKIQSFQEIKQVIEDYLHHGGQLVALTPFAGEIFVNPQIIDIIEKIHSLNKIKKISTYTNASLLHRVDLNKLMQSGLTDLYISTAPLDEKTYIKIYRSNFYPRVLENIKNLLIAFENCRNKTIKKIEISFRSDRTLEECLDLPDYINHIKPFLSKNVYVTSMSSYDSWSGMIKDEDLLPGMQLLHTQLSGKISPCSRIYNTQILVDGSIRLCGCRFDNGAKTDELYIGNIADISLIDAYNSTKAKRIRESFESGNILNICQKCSWYDS